ncbi:MAG: Arthrobacter phage Tank [Bacteroidota bacterium]|jgi:hypothetical protein
MGYYVHSIDSYFFLDKNLFDSVYKKMCDLNDYDDLKRGGSSQDGEPFEGKYNPNKWFSWMDYNYPETCSDLFAILRQVGFEWTLDDDGNMVHLAYPENKSGNEDYFLCCFAGFVKVGCFIQFEGEDGARWQYFFNSDEMVRFEGEVTTTWVNPEAYTFGQMSESDKQVAIWAANFRKQMEEKRAKSLES